MKSRLTVIGMAFAAVGTIALGASHASADGYSSPRGYVAPYNWSGFYGGVNAGWMGSTVDWAFRPPVPAGANQSFSLDNDSAIWGGQVGIQHQFGGFVLGVEGAVIDSGRRHWASHDGYGIVTTENAQAKIGTIWTIGPRLGWAHSRWLFYVSGGYASTDIDTRTINRTTGIVRASENAGSRHDGWYIGGGVEHALHGNLILGLEYQHLDFNTRLQCPPGDGTCAQGAAVFADRDIDASADVIRLRLSYKFGARDELRPLK